MIQLKTYGSKIAVHTVVTVENILPHSSGVKLNDRIRIVLVLKKSIGAQGADCTVKANMPV
jgi:hypothetical protein